MKLFKLLLILREEKNASEHLILQVKKIPLAKICEWSKKLISVPEITFKNETVKNSQLKSLSYNVYMEPCNRIPPSFFPSAFWSSPSNFSSIAESISAILPKTVLKEKIKNNVKFC